LVVDFSRKSRPEPREAAMSRQASLARLMLMHSTAFLFLVVVSVSAAGGIVTLHQETARQSLQLNRLVQVIHVLRGNLYRQFKELYDYVFVGDPDALVEFQRFNAIIEADLALLAEAGQSSEFQPQIAALQAAYDKVRTGGHVFMNQVQADFTATQLLEVFEHELEQGDMLQYERAYQATETLVDSAQEDLRRQSLRFERLAIGLLVLPIGAGALLLWLSRRLLRRQVIEPVGALVGAVEAYRGGDLERQVAESGPAELLTLQAAFNRMARDLNTSQRALVDSERQAARGALVPIIAHNIRNPLASIRATAQVMDEPALGQEQRRSLHGIVQTVDRLDAWLSQFLTFLNPMTPERRATSLRLVADHALQLLDHGLKRKKLVVARQGWERDSALAADQALLEQAVCGLLTNAIEASPPGGELLVEVDGDAATARLSIRDRGPGMPFAEGPSGFTPGPSTKPRGGGLGVPFARRICEIHGGELRFEAAPGGGTRVVIALPKQAEQGAQRVPAHG